MSLTVAEIPLGLAVLRLADDVKPTYPCRWRIRHTASGLDISEAMCQENALAGAAWLGQIADWTQGADRLRNTIDDTDLYVQLSYLHCDPPGTQRADRVVSNNGQPTENDVVEAAAWFKDAGYNALQVLYAMAHEAPWMGLDTNDFNAAHDRICELADAA